MLRIFKKLGTDEAFAMLVDRTNIQFVCRALENQFGGSWLYVEDVEIFQGIKFNDGQLYRGFETESYCPNVKHLKL